MTNNKTTGKKSKVEIARMKQAGYMINHFRDIIDHAENYMDNGRTVAEARVFLKAWKLIWLGKEKEAQAIIDNIDNEIQKELSNFEKK